MFYFSIKTNTDEVEERKRFDVSQACIGRVTAAGTPVGMNVSCIPNPDVL